MFVGTPVVCGPPNNTLATWRPRHHHHSSSRGSSSKPLSLLTRPVASHLLSPSSVLAPLFSRSQSFFAIFLLILLLLLFFCSIHYFYSYTFEKKNQSLNCYICLFFLPQGLIHVGKFYAEMMVVFFFSFLKK